MLNWPSAGEDIKGTCDGVHAWARQRFVYMTDDVRWKGDQNLKGGEHWEKDDELLDELEKNGYVRGDCDAFAKMCWLAMRRLNAPARLVFCLYGNTGHLVCEAQGWIMDNRQIEVVPREELEKHQGYMWLSKSGYLPGEEWTTC